MISFLIHALILLGKILLGILIFLILLLLCILFAPVFYRLKAVRDVDGKAEAVTEQFAEGRFHWLLFVLRGQVRYSEKGLEYEIRIFGIPVFAFIHRIKNRKKKTRLKSTDAKAKNVKSGQSMNDVRQENDGQRTAEAKTGTAGHRTAEARTINDERGSAEAQESDHKNALTKQKKQSFPDRIKGIIASIQLKIRIVIRILRSGNHLIHSKAFESTRKFLLQELLLIWKQIRPTLEGRIHFGFEDPALTGQVLGGICAIDPMIPTKLELKPDFEASVLEGDLQGKGKVIIGFVLFRLFRIYRYKPLKQVIRKIKRICEEMQ